jgi:tetratricopeptide (TPR) repeat protein
VLALLVLEAVLRMVGFGHPTSFLLPSVNHQKPTWVQNNQFTWRFFGPRLSRRGFPLSIAREKDPHSVRIFVFGESAAYGDPQPEFGLPRFLQTMLSLRHPHTKFEVVSTGITAINSHVIRAQAADCAKAGGDVWVIYMGNNEVVGPFGAGTVFGGKTPPLPFIHAVLALKTTRVGQLFDTLAERLRPPAGGGGEWGGMQMFLGSQVRASDPGMRRTHDYYARNLSDIVRTGRRAGAGVVVSSVAVNLRDCAPFGSERRADLTAAEKAEWERDWQSAQDAHDAGWLQAASDDLAEAAKIDDTYAELRFRQAECLLALGDRRRASQEFAAARDFDTLRFRCDAELNDRARQVVVASADARVVFADAAAALAERSPDGIPGENFFYEHVHLNFEGNYWLARTVGEQVEKLLASTTIQDAAPWPTAQECAQRMGWSERSEWEALRQIAGRLREAPFTAQSNHAAQMQRLDAALAKLAPAAQPSGMAALEKNCATARALVPDDPELDAQLALLQAARGAFPEAVASQRRELDAVPSDTAGWANLGLFLSGASQFEAAADAFRHAQSLDPLDVTLTRNLGRALWKSHQRAAAEKNFRQVIAAQPGWSMAWMDFGEFLEEANEKTEASNCFRRALLGRSKSLPDFLALAHFCESRSWYEAAASNYLAAIQLDALNLKLRVDAGGNFALAGNNAAAEGQFRAALRLDPAQTRTRLNLAVALMKEGRAADARQELHTILQQDPANALALQYAAQLRDHP